MKRHNSCNRLLNETKDHETAVIGFYKEKVGCE